MKKYVLIILLGCLTACTPTQYCEPAQSRKLTAGVVQREIRLGMPASDVVSILGAPNIVSLDEDRNEVWAYDKISSRVEYSSSGTGVWFIILGGASESGYKERSQRTLTIIVKFDGEKRVKDFNYHSSSF